MLSKFEQNRYKHIDTEKFYLQFLNNNANKMITHN
jgi:hypothetical protein